MKGADQAKPVMTPLNADLATTTQFWDLDTSGHVCQVFKRQRRLQLKQKQSAEVYMSLFRLQKLHTCSVHDWASEAHATDVPHVLMKKMQALVDPRSSRLRSLTGHRW